MIVATIFSAATAELFLKWLEQCAELGGIERTELIVLGPGPYWDTSDYGFQFHGAAEAWGRVTFIRDRNEVKDQLRWQNLAFGSIAWHIQSRTERREPWLFCEPTSVPLEPGWLTKLEAAYQKGGKPFMGSLVRPRTGIGDPPHMSHTAVYPPDVCLKAPDMVSEKKMNLPYWIRGAHQVVRQMTETDLTSTLFGATNLLSRSANEPAPANPVESPPANGPDTLERMPVVSHAQLCEIISINVKTETARTKLMAYLREKKFLQKNFGALVDVAQ